MASDSRMWWILIGIVVLAAVIGLRSGPDPEEGGAADDPVPAEGVRTGTEELPLRLVLVRLPWQTEEETLADYQPMMEIVARESGLKFDLVVTKSFDDLLQEMIEERGELAFIGPQIYARGRDFNAVEFLAASVVDGSSVYDGGIYKQKGSELSELEDLRGKRVAFMDITSTSGYSMPLAELYEAGIDPEKDLEEARLEVDHEGVLQALVDGEVDAACCAVFRFEEELESGEIDLSGVELMMKIGPIPHRPLVVHPKLSAELKSRLREVFGGLHMVEGIEPGVIRGYRGRPVEGFDVNYPTEDFDRTVTKLLVVTDRLRARMLLVSEVNAENRELERKREEARQKARERQEAEAKKAAEEKQTDAEPDDSKTPDPASEADKPTETDKPTGGDKPQRAEKQDESNRAGEAD